MSTDQKRPYSREELEALLPRVEAELHAIQAEYPDARPVPPLTAGEARDFLTRAFEPSLTRPLTSHEHILIGQLICQFEMAVRAETLSLEGRYYVISETALATLTL